LRAEAGKKLHSGRKRAADRVRCVIFLDMAKSYISESRAAESEYPHGFTIHIS
jgi:hypothetical protein